MRHARARIVLAALLTLAGASCADATGSPAEPETTMTSSPDAPTEGAGSPTSGPPSGSLWGTAVQPPVSMTPVTLTDQHGRAYRLPSAADPAEVTLLYFGYTHCADICPDTMAEIAVALRAVPHEVAERVDVVFVTVDPARDDPERLREWIDVFGEDFTALTGPLERIQAIQRRLGLEPSRIGVADGEDYFVGHPVEYLALAPDGTVRLTYPWEITAPQLQEDLTTLVEEGWTV